MDITSIPLFAALEKRMNWLGERETVLAENVANADTPGYVAEDISPPDFGKMLSASQQSLALATTEPGHIQIASDINEEAHPEPIKNPTGGGDHASLEDEMMKVSNTANDFALTTTVLRANLSMIKSVLGGS